jgi:hypothetical protein
VAESKGVAPLTVYTTWNRIVKAAAKLGDYPGLVALADDVPARLVPLILESGVQAPGWLEVEIQDHSGNYGPCFYDGKGHLAWLKDYIPHAVGDLVQEGVAVSEEILVNLDK